MNLHKLLPLVLMITSFTVLVEVYVLYHWTKYVKARSLHKAFYIAPWIISSIVILSALALNLNRIISPDIVLQFNLLLVILSFWYLPKMLIVPFLLVKDLMKLFKYIIFLVRNKKNIVEKSNTSKKTDEKRREVISNIGWSMALVPFGVAGYGILKTTINPRVHHVSLDLPNFPINLQNFKIVQISDIHAGSYYSTNQFKTIRQTVNMLNPDVVVITGDFVNFRTEELRIIEAELSRIDAKYGVFGCMGNHDHYVNKDKIPQFIDRLENLGVKMLVNSNHTIDTGMGFVQIAGVDNTGMTKQDFADFDKAMLGLDESNSIIMLCHDPNNWEKSIVGQRKIELTLAGHTHGGQFGVTVFGKEYSPAGLAYKQVAGLYQLQNQYIYVNRGVGMTGPPFRVGINPEVTLIRLRRATDLV